MTNLLLAVVLCSVALAIVGYLLRVLWRAAGGPVFSGFERSRLRGCEDRVARGDARMKEGNLAAAVSAFAGALYTKPVRSRELFSAVERLHTGVLSRLIAASDQRHGPNVGMLSLAVADRVLRKRKTLQLEYLSALQTGTRLRRRELEREMRANAAELKKAVRELSAEVMSAAPGSSLH